MGKPVLQRHPSDDHVDSSYGSWMKESCPEATMANDDVIWETKEENAEVLFQYANKADFQNDIQERNYTLPVPYMVHYLLNCSDD